MLKNYLTVAWRTLRRGKVYAIINVGGLAVAMAACLLIGLFVQQELSFDDFHEKADRIFLAGAWMERGGKKAMFGTPFQVGETLEGRFSQVEAVARTSFPTDAVVKTGGARYEDQALYAGARFFDVFTFPLAQGDPQTALAEPNTVVLTPQAARKYFGEEDPMGRTLTIDAREEGTYTVTGVTEPVPENTYLSFDLLLSAASINPGLRGAGIYLTFTLLRTPASVEALRKLQPKELDEGARDEQRFSFVPLPDLYLSDFVDQPGFRGDPRYLYIFSAIAAFILLIAAINYANLATARAAQRTREVGIRRAVGATRVQVARQFLGESVLLTLAALGVALLLARLTLPAFGALLGTTLALDLTGNSALLLGLLALVLVVGLLAGSYPALYLSGFRPTHILGRQQGRSTSSGSDRLRRGLVAFQFAISIALLIGAGVVWQQLHYMQTKDLGFDAEHVVVLPMGSALEGRSETVKQALRQHPNVLGVAAASAVPGAFRVTSGVRFDYQGEEKKLRVKPVNIDSDVLDVLDLRLKEGRGFSGARPADSTGAFILNEAALDSLGWQTGVGKPFEVYEKGQVIGVVENFHFASPRQQIEPVAFSMRSPAHERSGSYYTIVARIKPEKVQETLAFLEAQWDRFVTERPFEYTFLDETFDEMYEAERRLSRTAGVFTALAVFIACMGIFGLAALSAERRTKEIAIRKTVGASARQIVGLLSKEFLVLVGAGFVAAVPVAWWIMQQWLQDFAYRVELSPWLFAGAGLAALLLAAAATSWQALRRYVSSCSRAEEALFHGEASM